MNSKETVANLKAIGQLAKDEALFNMALSHLFAVGRDHFTAENYTAALKSIDAQHNQAEKDGSHKFMSRAFEKALLDLANQLSMFPLFDLLLYIKKHTFIPDPEAADAEEPDSDE